jgi:integrase
MAGLYKRNGIYWGRVERQGKEHRRSLKTKDRKTAEGRIRAWISELEGTAFGEKPRHTYAEAEARFISDHFPTLKRRGAERYATSLMNLSTYFGGRILHEISSALLSEFETARRNTTVVLSIGKGNSTRTLNGVSSSTIRRDLACLSSLMSCAVEWEWIDANPVPAFLKRKAKRGLKENPPKTRYLTVEEEVRILAAASPLVAVVIMLAIDTGLRSEELFSLKWWQVDFVRGIITTTTFTKSGRIRAVPLPSRSAALLGKRKGKATDYVFVNPDTGERYVSMKDGIKAAWQRAEIAKCTMHDFRRTAGCRWLQRDRMTMAEVSILLGHSSYAVTEKHYAFLEGEKVAASVVKLELDRTKTGSHPNGDY